MILDCVLTAVNENSLYIDFIPLFINTWNKLYPQVDVKIVLIAPKIPDKVKEYKNSIILFPPIEGVPTSFISQYIRLLYPGMLDYKHGVMISDIDMIPMSRSYYTDNIFTYDRDKFIYMREDVCFSHKQIAMCYNVATPSTWKDVMKISSFHDIKNRLLDVYRECKYVEGHGNVGWSQDQLDLYKYVFEWNKITSNFISLKEKNTKFCRLDRNTFDINDNIIKERITTGGYTAYHCFRPMKKYRMINEMILDLL